jgi:hypothetical protein
VTSTTPKKPFSMIREFHLAYWFTLGNAVCGTAGLFATITYVQTGSVRHLYFAGALVLAAFVFDVFDGRVARWRQTLSRRAFPALTSSKKEIPSEASHCRSFTDLSVRDFC